MTSSNTENTPPQSSSTKIGYKADRATPHINAPKADMMDRILILLGQIKDNTAIQIVISLIGVLAVVTSGVWYLVDSRYVAAIERQALRYEEQEDALKSEIATLEEQLAEAERAARNDLAAAHEAELQQLRSRNQAAIDTLKAQHAKARKELEERVADQRDQLRELDLQALESTVRAIYRTRTAEYLICLASEAEEGAENTTSDGHPMAQQIERRREQWERRDVDMKREQYPFFDADTPAQVVLCAPVEGTAVPRPDFVTFDYRPSYDRADFLYRQQELGDNIDELRSELIGDDERSLPTATVAYSVVPIRGDAMEIVWEIQIGDETATTFKSRWNANFAEAEGALLRGFRAQ